MSGRARRSRLFKRTGVGGVRGETHRGHRTHEVMLIPKIEGVTLTSSEPDRFDMAFRDGPVLHGLNDGEVLALVMLIGMGWWPTRHRPTKHYPDQSGTSQPSGLPPSVPSEARTYESWNDPYDNGI